MPSLAPRVVIEEEARAYQKGSYLNLRGGINNSVTDELIEDDELSDARNYVPDELNSGLLIKREGVTKQLATQQSEAFNSIYQGLNADYFSTSTTIKNWSGTTLLSGLTSTSEPDWTTMTTRDIFVNGIDPPRKSDGTAVGTVNLLGSPPTFKYIEAANNFLYGAGHSEGELRWAALGTIETWTSTQAYTITNQDDPCRGLKKFHDVLMFFCEKSFHHVRGVENTVQQVTYSSFEEGCTSHRSIVPTPYGIFWWSNAGMVWSPQGFGASTLKYPTREKIPATLNGLNRNRYSLIHGAWHERLQRVEMFVFNGASTTVNMAIYYYPREDSIWVQDGLGIQAGASASAVLSGVEDVYIGSAATNGYLYLQDGDTDDGTAITAYAETKRDSTEYGPLALKRCEILTPMIQTVGTQALTYGVYLNNATTLTRSWTLNYTGSGVATEKNIGLGRNYHKIKQRLSDSTALRTRPRGFVNRGYVVTV